MVLSAIYILDAKGKVLISRNYRGDVENGVIEKFFGLATEREDEGQLTPLLQTPEVTFAYIKHKNLYVVATTKKNSNIVMIFALLHKICSVSSLASRVEGPPGFVRDVQSLCTRLGVRGIFQRRGGREHQGQLCHHLRASR